MSGPRDYTRATLMSLAHHSGGICYYPGCTEPVLRRHESGEMSFVVQISHIKAAYPNGPRYDPLMSDLQRADFPNLMLLCKSHHTDVDKMGKVDIYTVEVLTRWKAQREADPAQALSRLREVTPAGLRRIVADGMAQRVLAALNRLEKNDVQAAALMRSLLDQLTEAYSQLRNSGVDPDTVYQLTDAAIMLRGMQDTLEEFHIAVSELIDFRGRGGFSFEQ
jgi:hypothetical protein